MAISVPQEVLERARRNTPSLNSPQQSFGSLNWISATRSGSVGIAKLKPRPVTFPIPENICVVSAGVSALTGSYLGGLFVRTVSGIPVQTAQYQKLSDPATRLFYRDDSAFGGFRGWVMAKNNTNYYSSASLDRLVPPTNGWQLLPAGSLPLPTLSLTQCPGVPAPAPVPPPSITPEPVPSGFALPLATLTPSPCSFPEYIDTNRDGVPDDWEIQYFGSVGSVNHATTDSDNDGHVNYVEFVFGTDPTNPSSKFAPTYTLSGNYFYLYWQSVYDRMYEVQGRASLFNPWSTLAVISGDGQRKTYVFDKTGISSFFFRLSARYTGFPIVDTLVGKIASGASIGNYLPFETEPPMLKDDFKVFQDSVFIRKSSTLFDRATAVKATLAPLTEIDLSEFKNLRRIDFDYTKYFNHQSLCKLKKLTLPNATQSITHISLGSWSLETINHNFDGIYNNLKYVKMPYCPKLLDFWSPNLIDKFYEGFYYSISGWNPGNTRSIEWSPDTQDGYVFCYDNNYFDTNPYTLNEDGYSTTLRRTAASNSYFTKVFKTCSFISPCDPGVLPLEIPPNDATYIPSRFDSYTLLYPLTSIGDNQPYRVPELAGEYKRTNNRYGNRDQFKNNNNYYIQYNNNKNLWTLVGPGSGDTAPVIASVKQGVGYLGDPPSLGYEFNLTYNSSRYWPDSFYWWGDFSLQPSAMFLYKTPLTYYGFDDTWDPNAPGAEGWRASTNPLNGYNPNFYWNNLDFSSVLWSTNAPTTPGEFARGYLISPVHFICSKQLTPDYTLSKYNTDGTVEVRNVLEIIPIDSSTMDLAIGIVDSPFAYQPFYLGYGNLASLFNYNYTLTSFFEGPNQYGIVGNSMPSRLITRNLSANTGYNDNQTRWYELISTLPQTQNRNGTKGWYGTKIPDKALRVSRRPDIGDEAFPLFVKHPTENRLILLGLSDCGYTNITWPANLSKIISAANLLNSTYFESSTAYSLNLYNIDGVTNDYITTFTGDVIYNSFNEPLLVF